jgi:hypothetical protein
MPTTNPASRLGTVCVLIVAAFYLSTIRDGHEWGDDFSQYIRHASNLATGLPYTATSYLYNADNPSVGPRVYPPGFPVVLAPVVRTFGLALRPMKVEIVLFFVAALLLIYKLIQPLMPSAAAAAVVLIVGLNPFFWDFKDQILSDVPFLFFFVATLLCLTRADESDRGARARTMLAALGGVAMFAAYATRVVGIVLLPSLVVRDLVRHRRLTKEGLVAAATFVVLAALSYAVGPRDSSYTDLLTITPAIIVNNIVGYLRWSSEIWENGYADLVRKALFLATAGLAAVGGVSLWKQPRAWLLVVVAFFYLSAVIVWPLAQGTRLLIPVIPIFVACSVLGAWSIDRAIAPHVRIQHVVLATLLAAVAATYIARYSTLPFGRVPEGIAKRESVALFDFVKTSTRPDDVIIFSRPRALALLTERIVTPPPRTDDACRLWRYIQRVRAGYIATGPGEANEEAVFLARFVRDFAPDLRELMRNADVGVYRVERVAVDCVDQRHAVR